MIAWWIWGLIGLGAASAAIGAVCVCYLLRGRQRGRHVAGPPRGPGARQGWEAPQRVVTPQGPVWPGGPGGPGRSRGPRGGLPSKGATRARIRLPQLKSVLGVPGLDGLLTAMRASERLMRDQVLDRAAEGAVSSGLLLYNIPARMLQGKQERAEIKIARSAAFRDQMLSGLRAQDEPQFEEIDTSLYMEVKLAGSAFQVISYSPAEQLVIPAPACWEFDVTPLRSGQRQITLSVAMRIEAEGIVAGRRGVSVLEKQIDVQVNIGYATRSFVSSNWQWLVPTALALAGTIAAWLVVPF
jgi:hypothetical protein